MVKMTMTMTFTSSVSARHLDSEDTFHHAPAPDIWDKSLPTLVDFSQERLMVEGLVEEIMTSYLPHFTEKYLDVTREPAVHPFANESSQKSKVVC